MFSRIYTWVCLTCGSIINRPGKDNRTCPWCDGCLELIEKELID